MADDILNYGAWLVAAIGATNWGIEEAIGTNIVTDTLALGPEAAGVAYLLIGVAGVLNLYQLGEEVL